MITVIAIDYLNQSIGLISWMACYGVIFYGHNEPHFINMSVDYGQAVTYSSTAFCMTSFTFFIARHIKLNDLDTGHRRLTDLVRPALHDPI